MPSWKPAFWRIELWLMMMSESFVSLMMMQIFGTNEQFFSRDRKSVV